MKADASSVLVCSCSHEPYAHKHFLDFLVQTQKQFKCGHIIHLGDLVDSHSASFHDHDPDVLSDGDEIDLAVKKLKSWQKAFPVMSICKGNHDIINDRRALSDSISNKRIRTIEEIYDFPKGWDLQWSHYRHGVKYEHGVSFGGQTPHLQAAQVNRQSTVIGHFHSFAGVDYNANDKDLIFGMVVGCGIDRKQRPFWYGRDFKRKPILGCGVVRDGKYAQFIPMNI
jgi:predicted phosphodiesterase